MLCYLAANGGTALMGLVMLLGDETCLWAMNLTPLQVPSLLYFPPGVIVITLAALYCWQLLTPVMGVSVGLLHCF